MAGLDNGSIEVFFGCKDSGVTAQRMKIGDFSWLRQTVEVGKASGLSSVPVRCIVSVGDSQAWCSLGMNITVLHASLADERCSVVGAVEMHTAALPSVQDTFSSLVYIDGAVWALASSFNLIVKFDVVKRRSVSFLELSSVPLNPPTALMPFSVSLREEACVFPDNEPTRQPGAGQNTAKPKCMLSSKGMLWIGRQDGSTLVIDTAEQSGPDDSAVLDILACLYPSQNRAQHGRAVLQLVVVDSAVLATHSVRSVAGSAAGAGSLLHLSITVDCWAAFTAADIVLHHAQVHSLQGRSKAKTVNTSSP